jgi:zinc protease
MAAVGLRPILTSDNQTSRIMTMMPNGRRPTKPIVLLFLLIAASIHGIVNCAWAAFADQVSETTLANGLKVIMLENHKAPLVTFQVWYRVGSRNEKWGLTGLSHMLEHMMFKGTQKVGPGEFSRTIERNGGDENAFTSSDFTAYYENIAADRVQLPIAMESDRMQGLLLREEDFDTERSVVMEERRLRTDDNPRAVVSEQIQATAFVAQPYHWPVIGWMEDIARFSLDDLKEHYRTYYTPANAFVVIVGDFSKEAVLPLIEQAFSSIPGGSPPEPRRFRDQPQIGERRILIRKEAQLAAIVKGFHVPNLEEPDSYTLEVIAAILSAGESSRLNRTLVHEKRLVLSADAENELVSKDPNLFSVSADIMPGKSPAQVEKALEGEIERLRNKLVGAKELRKTKNQLESAFTFAQDSLFYQGMLLATYEIVSSWRDADKYVPAIEAVSAHDVRRVARKYLIPMNCTTALLLPLPTKEKKPGLPAPVVKQGVIR